MKKTIFYLKTDRVLKLAFLISSLFLLFQIIFIVITYFSLPPFIPLYLQRPWGILQIATKKELLILPSLTFLLILINTAFAGRLYGQSVLASRILLGGQAITGTLATIAVLQIILLIT